GGRPQRIREKVEDSARIRLPARGLRERAIEFIQDAVVYIDGYRMTVPCALAAAFNRSVQRNRVRAGVTFVGVEKGCQVRGLGPWDSDEGNANRTAVVVSRSEIGMQRRSRPNRCHVGCGVGSHGELIEIGRAS